MEALAPIGGLAGLFATIGIGMGVVFVALFGLSVYIEMFKRATARIDGSGKSAKPAAPAPAPAAAAPAAASDDEAAQVAALAVGLHLDGSLGAPPKEVMAAIAYALGKEQERRATYAAQPADGSWRSNARAGAMGPRQRGGDMRGAWQPRAAR